MGSWCPLLSMLHVSNTGQNSWTYPFLSSWGNEWVKQDRINYFWLKETLSSTLKVLNYVWLSKFTVSLWAFLAVLVAQDRPVTFKIEVPLLPGRWLLYLLNSWWCVDQELFLLYFVEQCIWHKISYFQALVLTVWVIGTFCVFKAASVLSQEGDLCYLSLIGIQFLNIAAFLVVVILAAVTSELTVLWLLTKWCEKLSHMLPPHTRTHILFVMSSLWDNLPLSFFIK